MTRLLQIIQDRLPLGPAPVAVLIIALLTGMFLLSESSSQQRADLRLWTFSNTHYDSFKDVIPAFEAEHTGVDVELQLVHFRVLDRRLRAAFWAGLDVPELVEINFNRVGGFFRGPIETVGFVDLTPYLERSDDTGATYLDRILPTRLEAYRREGKVFGLPCDVHPHALAYRRDIFEAEGIDPDDIETWDDLVQIGRRLTIPDQRYMLHLSDTGADTFEALLHQRDGGLFDAEGNVRMDDEVAVRTMVWYVPLIAGPDAIADNPADAGQAYYRAIADGYIISFLCPDWLSSKLELSLPAMSGKLALMPLPAVEPGGRRTTTRSGTMIGMTRATQDRDAAWKLVEHLYFDREQLADRFRTTNTLPPDRGVWDHPAFHEPREYWSGQRIGEIFIELAEDVPVQYSSAYSELAASKVGEVVAASCAYYKTYGGDGFEAFVRDRLKQAADDVRRHMERNPT